MSTHKKAHPLDGLDGKSGQAVTPYEPTFEEIRVRAYEVYVQPGRIDGFDIEDWLHAERELRENGNKGAADDLLILRTAIGASRVRFQESAGEFRL